MFVAPPPPNLFPGTTVTRHDFPFFLNTSLKVAIGDSFISGYCLGVGKGQETKENKQ